MCSPVNFYISKLTAVNIFNMLERRVCFAVLCPSRVAAALNSGWLPAIV